MWIIKWKPYAECFRAEEDPPGLSACKSVLNKMPASKFLETFGTRGTEGVDEPLPVKFSDCQFVTSSCFHISSSTNPSCSRF